jgi:hypothetical protein
MYKSELMATFHQTLHTSQLKFDNCLQLHVQTAGLLKDQTLCEEVDMHMRWPTAGYAKRK